VIRYGRDFVDTTSRIARIHIPELNEDFGFAARTITFINFVVSDVIEKRCFVHIATRSKTPGRQEKFKIAKCARDALDFGISAVLEKPVGSQALLQTIGRLLARGQQDETAKQ